MSATLSPAEQTARMPMFMAANAVDEPEVLVSARVKSAVISP